VQLNRQSRYVLTVDTGDAQPRTVLSGLRGVVEPSHLCNRRCVIVCNLPTRDMKGVVSTGLMLVATSAEGAKIPLTPPETSPIGTRVTLPNFPGDVAPAGTNLKKLWERIGDKFSTDASCAALLEGGGILTTPQGGQLSLCRRGGAGGGRSFCLNNCNQSVAS
jgi:tRNA-binding EMAP/Myf-like protein